MRKAQAALEFLMTYGWAILVVLVAIGALAYFGVLSPDRFLPSKCTLPSGIACTDFVVGATSIQVTLRNGLGSDINTVTVAASGCTVAATGALTNGQQAGFTVSGCTIPSGSKYSGDLNISYTSTDSGLAHTLQGAITARAQ